MPKSFWAKGIQFECQGSGKCCVSHGGYGSVFLTRADREKLARRLGLELAAFTKRYCEKRDDVWRLKDGVDDDCLFLEGKRCGVYEDRPVQCRTWPFWPEVLNARTWTEEVQTFCPGVGKGRVWSPAEIEKELEDQLASEREYGS